MAAPDRHHRGGHRRHGDQRSFPRRQSIERGRDDQHQRHPAAPHRIDPGFRRGPDDDGPWCGRFDHHNDGRWERKHDDDRCSRRFDDDDFIAQRFGGRSRFCSCPSDIATAVWELDQPCFHDDGRRVEYRLGLPLCAGACRRSRLSGVRGPCRLVSDRYCCNQRDRAVGTIGERTDRPRVSDTCGPDNGQLHLDRQGHRFVVTGGAIVHRCDSAIVGVDPARTKSGSALSSELVHAGQFGVELVEKVVVATPRVELGCHFRFG
jgi:hypothetical protein